MFKMKFLLVAIITAVVATTSVPASAVSLVEKPPLNDPECRYCIIGAIPALGSYQGTTVSSAGDCPPLCRWQITTSINYWSVVAVRPFANTDHDLGLYSQGSVSFHSREQASREYSTKVDFVAIDSNIGRRPYGTFYPRTFLQSGTSGFNLEFAAGANLLKTGQPQVIRPWIVAVRDVCSPAGFVMDIKLTQGSPAIGDPDMFLLETTTGETGLGAYMRTPAQVPAARRSTTPGIGSSERITYTAPYTGCYGLVIVNSAGAGSYTLERIS